MTNLDQRIVVVGSGHAGVEAAAALRQHGHTGPVTIVGDEPDLPYQRPPLSKEFLKSSEDAGLPLKGEAFYAAKDITLRLGRHAASIDRERRELELAGGERLAYDHLVLATGARNRIPPIPGLDRAPMLELRTLADARLLHEQARFAAPRRHRRRRLHRAGGGRAAARPRHRRRPRRGDAHRLMGRVLSARMSAHFRFHHEALGTRLHFETLVRGVHEAPRGCSVALSSGETLETDAILVAAGVTPNTELAQRAGLAVDNGIVADARLVTSDPAISAIGDCVAYPNAHAGGMARLESVQNAVDQAKFVAARLCGEGGTYHATPWFWSNQGSQRLQIAGLGDGHDDAVLRGDPLGEKFSIFLYRGDRLLAVESVNAAADHMVARRLIGQGTTVPKALAADPSADLKALL